MPNRIKKEVSYNYLWNMLHNLRPLKEIKAQYSFTKALLNNEKEIREVLKPITDQIKPYPPEFKEYSNASQNLNAQRTKDLKGVPPAEQASIQDKFKREAEDLNLKYAETLKQVEAEEKKYQELMTGMTNIEFYAFYEQHMPEMTANQLELIQDLIQ